ncbi:MAG: tetratricopeptide repeat protein [Flavobacteriales bacterium]|nr:tetratricopeptide repeat protein [Flavobacteriales bacterium]
MFEEQGSFFEEDYNSHIERFEKMLVNDESYFFDVDVFEYMAEHYLEDGNVDQALRALEVGISQHPSSAIILLRKAQIHSSTGRIRSGHELLNQAENLAPNNDEVFLTRASLYSQEHKHLDAIKNFLKAIDLCEADDIDDIYLDLAFEYENIEKYDLAIKALKKALEMNPANEGALYEIGYCFDQDNRMEGCVEFCLAFIDENPYSFTAWYILGNTYSKMDQFEKAIDAYDYCTIIKDTFSSAYFNSANCYGQMEDYHAAIELYFQTFDFESEQGITHNYIAECFEKLDDNENAIKHYNKAIELDDKLGDAWLGKAIVKDRMGFTNESIELLKVATKIDEENHEYWYVLGEAYEKQDQYESAKDCYEIVIALEPTNINAWLDLSNVLTEIASVEIAAELIQKGLEANEQNEELMYRLVAYFLQSGRKESAKSQLEAALDQNFDAHQKLFNYYPEAQNINDVLSIIEMFKK